MNVLRMMLNDEESHRVTLIVHGYLVGKWAEMLEHECLELSRPGLHVVLDLSGVLFIGRTGLEVLARLSRSGVEITGCSRLITDILEQEGIEVASHTGDS